MIEPETPTDAEAALRHGPILLPCCEAAVEDGKPTHFVVSRPGKELGQAQVLPEPSTRPAEWHPASAWHEAGHCVVGVIAGRGIESATIVGQPQVNIVRITSEHRLSAAVAMAGDIAAAWERRTIVRRFDAQWQEPISRVAWRAAKCGGCDDCRLAQQALLANDLDEAAALGWLRETERRVIEAVTSYPVSRAVAAVAAALREFGTISGDQIVQIAGHYLTTDECRSMKEKLDA